MKKILSIAVILLICVTTKAQEAQIEFKNETIDYGIIENGSNGVRIFEFINTGKAPLVITNVKSSCGCTVPKKPSAPIAPGEKGEIEVKYDTKRTGFIRKTITVTSNASNTKNGISYLKIKGEVKKPDTSSLLEKKPTSVMKQ